MLTIQARSGVELVDGNHHQGQRIHAEANARGITDPIVVDEPASKVLLASGLSYGLPRRDGWQLPPSSKAAAGPTRG